MIRVIIICEGQTEQEFCKDVLYPYFIGKNISVEYPLIKKTRGGIVNWSELKKQVEMHLKQDSNVFVTTFIDYYALPYDYLIFEQTATSKINKVVNIEQGMRNEVDSSINYRFIPYVQLHEFECFLFYSMDILRNNFLPEEANFVELEKTINSFTNLEDINNHPDTAPSKRLLEHIRGYNKVVYGACIAFEIGLTNIRTKCPHFNNWIEQLENI